jgi:uncharacterized surface protein with fasciclin (FAS1) repeats
MKSYRKNITSFLITVGLTFTVISVQAQTVMQKLKANNQTTEFARALEDADIDNRINQKGPFTLFAPSNDAFNNLSSIERGNNELLLNHIFTGMATERSLKAMSNVTCLSGRNLTLQEDNEQGLTINSIRIVTSNIKAENGVIHIIDGVIK